MPANLPPQYKEIEAQLRTAKSPEKKIAILEELLSIIPKHKGTEKIQAMHKTKIAKLKSQLQKKNQTAKHGFDFNIEKAGAGQIILIGPPNSGKSMLIKSLTNANPEIGDYPFTTHFPYPAMMKYENIQIQLIDSPPITLEYMETWHAEMIKVADGVLVILDESNPDAAFDYEVLLERLATKRIEIVPEDREIPPEKRQFWKKTILITNKRDITENNDNFNQINEIISSQFTALSISAVTGKNLDILKQRIFALLNILRVYSKAPGKKVDYNDPYVLKKGSSLMDMARTVHKDFAEKLKFARIWGKEKYQGQKVTREYVLQDEDVIELHI